MSSINNILAQGVKPVQLANPLDLYTAAMRARYMGSQNAMAEQQIARTNALNSTFSNPNIWNPQTGQMDVGAVASDLGPQGGSAMPQVLQGMQNYEKAKAETQASQVKAQSGAYQQTLERWGQLAADPNNPNSLQNAESLIKAEHSDPVLGPLFQRLGVTPEGSIARLQATYNASQGWNPANGPSPYAAQLSHSALLANQLLKEGRPLTMNLG
ncbi:MAG: hypothetical protein ACYCOU_23095, partial [Sulfobacillus sp.]